ncbi:MAG: L-arabinose isomerase [Clostridiales bacterium]|nr:L-arabinose isomerase [Clostridiales bacterium]
MKSLKQYEFWFITGSQHLYGEETLKRVAEDASAMVAGLDGRLCGKLVYKGVVKTPDEITSIIKEANYRDKCAGIITWMHTFSPSKMWINGLKILHKPMLHLHTQFNREIPFDEIDMDFMNLNQSAHGDREHGFIGARLRIPRKVVVGYWDDAKVLGEVSDWMRSAVGIIAGQSLKVVRFADNMREVAVTEGDKVEAQIKFGWAINSLSMGDLVQEMDGVGEADIEAVYEECAQKYEIVTDNIDAVKYQIKIEIAMKRLCEENGFGAVVTNFENLCGMEQLPGLAIQRLMEAGYGFGAEGDWKTAALLWVMKSMEVGLPSGTSFMEDYTYHLAEGKELILGAHMLEVDPSIADGTVKIDVQPLGIGGKGDPARMIFDGKEGDAICASLIDMGGRMRLIVADVKAVKPIQDMPKLPVARVMWSPLPDFETGAKAWIYAGGAHHAVMSYSITADMMRDYAEIAGIEYVHIGAETQIEDLKRDLMLSDLLWK